MRARCSEELLDLINKYCGDTQRDVSDVIRCSLWEYIHAEQERSKLVRLARAVAAVDEIDKSLAQVLREKIKRYVDEQ